MKKVLSLLVAFVFLQVESWALSGGPAFNSVNGNPSIIGTYGGVLIPTSSIGVDPTAIQPASIGVFSVSIPETGISVGVAIVFVNGTAFIGQIAGIGDADSQTIQGLIGATSNFNIGNGNNKIFAQGSFKAKVIQGAEGTFTQAPAGSGNGSSSGSGGSTSSASAAGNPAEIGATNSARLQGTAEIGTFDTLNAAGTAPDVTVLVNYSLDGIKQNNIPANVTTVPFNFGGA